MNYGIQLYSLRDVAESEGLAPSGPEEVGRCMAYLKTLKE